MSRALRRPLWASFLNDPWMNYTGPARLFDQYLGEVMDEDELSHLNSLLPSAYAWWNGQAPSQLARRTGSEHGTSVVEYGDSQFRVNLDIRQFRPEEVNVRLLDNRVVVHAKHEEREDQHGFIKREFTRSYVLPKDVDASKLEAKMGADGTLRVTAPRLQPEKPKETVIPIQHEPRPSASASNAAAANQSAASGQQK